MQQAELKEAVPEQPAMAGIELANWTLRQAQEESGPSVCLGALRHQPEPQQLSELPPSTRGQALHRLGFALKRPKKRLVKADEGKREASVAEYAALYEEARRTGAKVFFADEAHFRADAELRGKWVLQGEPALVDSTSPRRGEQAGYCSAVCLETGEVEWMELEGNSNAVTSAAFLLQLRETLRAIERDLGQCPGAPRRGRQGAPADAWTGAAAGEPARGTARTATPMRRSGAGPERRPPETGAWGPRLWCRRRSATSSAGWPAGEVKSNGAAGPSCNQGPSGC